MTRSIPLGPFTFFADDSAEPGSGILANGFNYEMHVVAELRKFLPASRGFLDIGAHCGIHTMIARTINPNVPIVAAEVTPFNLALLLRNIIHNSQSNITVLPFALSDATGIVRANEHDPMTCLSTLDAPHPEFYTRLACAFRLDDFAMPPIDLIKIDIEGFEIRALKGASKIMATRPRIILEFCLESTHRSGLTPRETLAWYFDQGYNLTVLDHQAGMRSFCTTPEAVLDRLAAFNASITDILAEPA